jgi:hypothetical protein
MAGAISTLCDNATSTYLAKYKQMSSYRKHMTNLHFIPQSVRKARIEKKMFINHTAVISINYTTAQIRHTLPVFVNYAAINKHQESF